MTDNVSHRTCKIPYIFHVRCRVLLLLERRVTLSVKLHIQFYQRVRLLEVQTWALVVSVDLLVLVASDFHIEFYTLSDLGNGYMTFWLVLQKNLSEG